MDIKEAFERNKLSKRGYKEVVIIDHFQDDRLIIYKWENHYSIEDSYGKYYMENWDEYVVQPEKVSLKEVDWGKPFYLKASLDIPWLIRICEKLEYSVNINHTVDTWYVYLNNQDAYCEGTSKSFKYALLEFLFDYACSKDNTIHRV